MTDRLVDTVALVTGASSGIGEATALALAAEGATVAIAARRRDRLEALAARIGDDSRVLVLETDVTDPDQARAMVDRTVAECGRLDTVINNAGVMLLGPIVDAPLEEWQQMVQLNVLGLLYTTHAALPHLLAAAERDPRRVADIVNVSSVAGRIARLGSGVYNATKFGVGRSPSHCGKRSPGSMCGSRSSSREPCSPNWPVTTVPRSSRAFWPPSAISRGCRPKTLPRRSPSP